MSAQAFPILKGTDYYAKGEAIPWAVAEVIREDALKHHDQTLEELASRGGLTWAELGRCFARHHAMLTDETIPSRASAYTMFVRVSTTEGEKE